VLNIDVALRSSGVVTHRSLDILDSNIKIFKYSNIQIFKYSNIQIFKYSNIQIFKYSNIQIFKYLKPKKAPGGDQITPKMLIELPNSAIEVICKLFNGIITLGYYPKKWKKSIIIMIPKPYRQISLLSCLSKNAF